MSNFSKLGLHGNQDRKTVIVRGSYQETEKDITIPEGVQ